MKSTELRIGNWVKICYKKENYNKIDQMGFFEFHELGKNDIEIKPIPLTEQWLKDFGFKLGEDEGYTYNEDIGYPVYIKGIRVIHKEDKFYLWIEIDEDTYYNFEWTEIKYVHQLQNLYFALTGKELIKT